MDRNYYPNYWSGCNPIHPVRSWAKVRKLVRDARRGDAIPPMVIEGDLGNGNMITGTHRAAANDLMLMLTESGKRDDTNHLIGYVSLEDIEIDEELAEAIGNNDYETINNLLDT